MTDILTSDFKNQPYWWDAARPEPMPCASIPRSVDVLIVGSGFTGLCAALPLLRDGRSVLVVDSEDPGSGASRRNAGFLGRTLKKSFKDLAAANGIAFAIAVYRELDDAYQSLLQLVTDEGIACHAVRCGRFIGATSAAHYDLLAAELEPMHRHLGIAYHMVSRASIREEMATDAYHGGAVIPDLGSIHSGLFHKGLLERVLAAGGIIAGRSPVRTIEKHAHSGFQVRVSDNSVQAREVVIATNGYTPRAFGWYARRVVPFVGYMAATEEIPPELLAKVFPRRRTVIDSNINIDFFRPAPDTSRVLFGGATGCGLDDVNAIAARLKGILARVLPDLGHVRLSHVWTGQCAGTFDMMPHIGRRDGIWYGMGYNFAGVPLGTLFGRKIAQKILGRPEGRSIFEEMPFHTAPFYTGRPWFVPLAMKYFDWQDRRIAATVS